MADFMGRVTSNFEGPGMQGLAATWLPYWGQGGPSGGEGASPGYWDLAAGASSPVYKQYSPGDEGTSGSAVPFFSGGGEGASPWSQDLISLVGQAQKTGVLKPDQFVNLFNQHGYKPNAALNPDGTISYDAYSFENEGGFLDKFMESPMAPVTMFGLLAGGAGLFGELGGFGLDSSSGFGFGTPESLIGADVGGASNFANSLAQGASGVDYFGSGGISGMGFENVLNPGFTPPPGISMDEFLNLALQHAEGGAAGAGGLGNVSDLINRAPVEERLVPRSEGPMFANAADSALSLLRAAGVPGNVADVVTSFFTPRSAGAAGLDIGSGIYGLLQSERQRKLAKQLAAQADPFGQWRGQYGQQLSNLMANPSSVTSLPGYQFQYDQGLQALMRQLAAGGQLGGGGGAIAAQRYGQDYAQNFYSNEANRLAQLAGAQFSPGAGASVALQGNISANDLASRALASIGYGVRRFL